MKRENILTVIIPAVGVGILVLVGTLSALASIPEVQRSFRSFLPSSKTPSITPSITSTGTSTTTPTSTSTIAPTWTLFPTHRFIPTYTSQPQVVAPTNAPAQNNVPNPTAKPNKAPCNCKGPDLECKDFNAQKQAQACMNYCIKITGQDIFNLDKNKDGSACEQLH